MNESMIWLGTALTMAVGVWFGYTALYEGRLDQPKYQVLQGEGAFEVRNYEPFNVARTYVDAQGRPGMRQGFRVLARYIFGGNQPAESMPMTAPVIRESARGESLAMTAPVVMQPDGMVMSFVMPSSRSLADLPVPNSRDVELARVDWGLVASVRFSGRGSQERFDLHESRLRRWLAERGLQARGAALQAQYNSPSAFPPLRRNEVLIPFAKAGD